MVDILEVINEATKEANAFENHAAKALMLEQRILYLQGLALVMNADADIHPEEKEYIRILLKSFEIDESILDSVVAFAEQPDKDTIQAFFRAFRRRPIAQLFLFDALMMTRRDGRVDEREKAVVDKMAEQLEVLTGTYQDIYDLFCHIKNKDWDESALYFTSFLLNPEHFKHLLDYFEVDLDELIKQTEQLREKRLKQLISAKINVASLEWQDLEYYSGAIEVKSGTKITTEHVDLTSSLESMVELILPKVQSDLDRGSIKINPKGEIENLDNDKAVVPLKELGLNYDREKKYLTLGLAADQDVRGDQIYAIACYLAKGLVDTSDPSIQDVVCFVLQRDDVAIASAKIHPRFGSERCFPKFNDEYSSEIVRFRKEYYLTKAVEYVQERDFTPLNVSPYKILTSGKIRIVQY